MCSYIKNLFIIFWEDNYKKVYKNYKLISCHQKIQLIAFHSLFVLKEIIETEVIYKINDCYVCK